MSGKSLLFVGALSLSSFAFAGVKSYDIVLDQTTKAGNTELKAGHYSVKVEGGQATFKDKASSKSFTAPVATAESDKKFDQTVVLTDKQGGSVSIREIDLDGSKTRRTCLNKGAGSTGL